MSVNLIPGDVRRTSAIRRWAIIAGVAILLLWLLLGLLQWLQLRTIDSQVIERDAVAQRVAVLEGEVASLSVFQRMADDVAAGNTVLSNAMGREVSWARLLLDLSRGVPTSASFTDISGQIVDPPPEGAANPEVFVPTDVPDVGFFVVSGYTTELFTPGVQELLRRFGAIDGFFQEYLTNAVVGDVGGVDVTTFTAEIRLNESIRTNRYVDGLPGLGS